MQSTVSEEWRPVSEYEGSYEVSNTGRVRSISRVLHDGHRWKGRELRLISRKAHDDLPRVQVTLHLGGHQRTRLVHHLVLEAFVGLRPDGTEACHWDGDASNNCLNNLRWATHLENEGDKRRHGTHHSTMKTHCPQGHVLADPNLVPGDAARGLRKCRACNIAHASAFKRGIPFTQEDADARYSSVMSGSTGAEQNACKRGHALVAPNLSPAALRDGRRACRACSQANANARYKGVPFDQEVADMKYRLIMEESS